jgi:hypothetical protein
MADSAEHKAGPIRKEKKKRKPYTRPHEHEQSEPVFDLAQALALELEKCEALAEEDASPEDGDELSFLVNDFQFHEKQPGLHYMPYCT